MSYSYNEMKLVLATEDGQRVLLKTFIAAQQLLGTTGAIMEERIYKAIDVWLSMACVDRLIEFNYLAPHGPNRPDEPRQYRVLIAGGSMPPASRPTT